jgi:hypothetical protein
MSTESFILMADLVGPQIRETRYKFSQSCVDRRKATDYSEIRKNYLLNNIQILQIFKKMQYHS